MLDQIRVKLASLALFNRTRVSTIAVSWDCLFICIMKHSAYLYHGAVYLCIIERPFYMPHPKLVITTFYQNSSTKPL